MVNIFTLFFIYGNILTVGIVASMRGEQIMNKIECYCNLSEEERAIIIGMDEDQFMLKEKLPDDLIGVGVVKYNDLYDRILFISSEQNEKNNNRIRLFIDFMSDLCDRDLLEYEKILHSLYLLNEFHIINSNVLENVKNMEYKKIDELLKKVEK